MEVELIRSKEARKVTLVGFFVNAMLAIFKLIAGIMGKSGAMVADAVHSLSDFVTDIIVLVGFKLTSKPEDECHNYGHDKYETIVTVIISIALGVVGYKILKSGIINILLVYNGETIPKPRTIALIAAIISIILKECLYRYTATVGKKINSSAVIANAWHHRSDTLSSIGTLIGITGAIVLGRRWTILDPIASIVVSLFIFKVAYNILIPSINELVEKSLSKEKRDEIIKMLNEFNEVKDFHKLRMRSLGSKAIIEGHILVDKNLNIMDAHHIATEVETRISSLVNENSIITIHIEPYLNE